MTKRPHLGSREWHEEFKREQQRFDLAFPWVVALSIIGAVTLIVLVATGVLPVWLLFV